MIQEIGHPNISAGMAGHGLGQAYCRDDDLHRVETAKPERQKIPCLMLLGKEVESKASGHSWRRNLSQVPPPTGSGKNRPPCHPFKEHPPMDLFLDSQQEETLGKGFPRRLSERSILNFPEKPDNILNLLRPFSSRRIALIGWPGQKRPSTVGRVKKT
jgi:hypothetical protein